jgi:CDP-diacylglycerol--glycerol-3-phosphate 3-phosphatidyltransferase
MENEPPFHLSPLHKLRLQWAGAAISSAPAFVIAASLLWQWWDRGAATRWLLAGVALWTYFLIFVWRNLSNNHRPGEDAIFPNLGTANLLTLGRAALLAALGGFLLSPRPVGALAWAPGAIYILAGIADVLDGMLARRQDHVSRLGEKLDLSLDGLGVLLASALLVRYGLAPGWYLSVGLARYLFLAGLGLLTLLRRPTYPLQANPLRRPLAGAQMGFMGAVLLPVFSPAFTSLAAIFFAAPFLINFAYDWLVVSGFRTAFARRPAGDRQRVTS